MYVVRKVKRSQPASDDFRDDSDSDLSVYKVADQTEAEICITAIVLNGGSPKTVNYYLFPVTILDELGIEAYQCPATIELKFLHDRHFQLKGLKNNPALIDALYEHAKTSSKRLVKGDMLKLIAQTKSSSEEFREFCAGRGQ
jgi:hypothetical protein